MGFGNLRQEHESDKQIANSVDHDRSLHCSAPGCRARWSVNGENGKLCGAHAWKPRGEWGAITLQQNALITDLAVSKPERDEERYRIEAAPLVKNTRRYKRLMNVIENGMQRRNAKQWAYDMQERHARGDHLTPTQIDAYKAVVNPTTELIDTFGAEKPFD